MDEVTNFLDEFTNQVEALDNVQELRSLAIMQMAKQLMTENAVWMGFSNALAEAEPEEVATIERLRIQVDHNIKRAQTELALTVLRKILGDGS